MGANAQEKTNELKRPDWQWYLLLLLLFTVLVLGVLVALPSQNSSLALIFGMVGFSIAFAIHYFDVSVGLNAILIQEPDQKKCHKLRMIEYKIVSCGMLVLTGGLSILLAAGISMFFRDCQWFFIAVYIFGALLLIFGVAKYVFCQRDWPRKAKGIVENQL